MAPSLVGSINSPLANFLVSGEGGSGVVALTRVALETGAGAGAGSVRCDEFLMPRLFTLTGLSGAWATGAGAAGFGLAVATARPFEAGTVT